MESPTVIIAAVVVGITTIITTIGTLITTQKNKKITMRLDKGQKEIHVLVNSRLTTALKEIESLKKQITALKAD